MGDDHKIYASPDFLGGTVSGNLFAVNELATGLSLGISNPDLSQGYINAVNLQTDVLNRFTYPVTGIVLDPVFHNSNDFLSMMAPTSGAIADIGLLGANTSNSIKSGLIEPFQLETTQHISGLCLGVLEQQTSFLGRMVGLDQSEWNNSLLDSMKFIDSGISTAIRSFPAYPTEMNFPILETIHEAAEVEEEDLSEHQVELDGFLNRLDTDLVDFRKACWQTFNKKGLDYIGQ